MVVAGLPVTEDGASSFPFRASSRLKPQQSAQFSASQRTVTSYSSCSTWLLIDVSETSLPFLRTLRGSAINGTSSPATRSSEKLTESTNNAAVVGSSASAKSRTLDLLTQPLVAPAVPKDKRMSLQQPSHPPVSSSSTVGRKAGFMSRFRGANHSISSADAFVPTPATQSANTSPLPPSSSWNVVEMPQPTASESSNQSRTVHFAVTSSSPPNSLQAVQRLVTKSLPMLAATSASDALDWQHEVHSKRLNTSACINAMQSIRPDAVYVGANATLDSRQALVEALLRSPSSDLKHVVVEPLLVRSLSAPEAVMLYDLAASHNLTLSLPVRWDSVQQPSSDETLLVLETLQEARAEQVDSAYTPKDLSSTEQDVGSTSLDKSFDVSISNIPTGLSGKDLNQAAVDSAALQTQLSKLQHQIKVKDEQISSLLLRRAVIEAPTSRETVDRRPEIVASVSETPPPPPIPKSPSSSTNLAASRVLFAKTDESPVSASSGTVPPGPLGAPAIITASSTPVRTQTADSPSSSKTASGRVISALTLELQETKALLDATRTALQTVRTQAATYQAQADDMRGTLSRARLETDSSISVLARKDRQISEALERARKAESEAKELGRAGRDWGTRVRQVEEELGKERIKCGRAEQQYEMLSLEWKQARTRLIDEVRDLRNSHAQQLRTMADEYQKILQYKDRLQQEWSLPPIDSDDGADTTSSRQMLGPTTLLVQISALNTQLVQYINKQVAPLLSRLTALEQRESQTIFSQLHYVTDELTRIKTLMRKGTITSPSQIGPPAPTPASAP